MKKEKKYIKLLSSGFTLIELLAVIIILAIVALIAAPIILGVIEDARLSANKSQVEMILSGAEQKFVHAQLTGEKIDFDGLTNIYEDLDTTNEKPANGELYITNEGDIALAISIDGICYYKKFMEDNINQNNSENCFDNIKGDIVGADYDNVFILKADTSLVVGDIKTTQGYYEYNDGGASSYEVISSDGIVTNEMDYVLLDNGLVAKLQYTNEINVMQLGAKIVDVNNYNIDDDLDSSKMINYAFNLVDSVVFPKNKDFIIRNLIYVTNSDLEINGNGSNLNTDNNYNKSLTGEKHFVTISYEGEYCYSSYCQNNIEDARVKNVIWNNLNIISLQTIEIPATNMQMSVYQASDIVIKNSIFRGPGPILTRGDDGEFASLENQIVNEMYFSNLDLWTNWKNITIENNEFYLSHDSVLVDNYTGSNVFFPGAGPSVQIRDTYSQGADTAVFKNNYVEQVNHDEIISIVSASETMSNISILNNHLVSYDGIRSSSVIGMSLSLVKSEHESTAGEVVDLNVSNNTFDLQSSYVGININHLGGNFNFTNNTVNYTKSTNDNPIYTTGETAVIKVGTDMSAISNIQDNNFNVSNSDIGYFINDNALGLDVINNTINLNNVSVETLFKGVKNVSDNSITGNAIIAELTRNTRDFANNTVISNEIINLHRIFSIHMTGTYNFTDNSIKMLDVTTTNRLMDLQIGGSSLTFDTNNDVIVNNNNNNVEINTSGRSFDLKVGFYNVALPSNLIVNYKSNVLPSSYTEVSSIIKDYINY